MCLFKVHSVSHMCIHLYLLQLWKRNCSQNIKAQNNQGVSCSSVSAEVMWTSQNEMSFKLEVAGRIWSVHERWLEGLRRAMLFCQSTSYPGATSGWSALGMSVSWNETTRKRFVAAVCWQCVSPLWQIMLWLFKMLKCFFQGRCASWNLKYLELFLQQFFVEYDHSSKIQTTV